MELHHYYQPPPLLLLIIIHLPLFYFIGDLLIERNCCLIYIQLSYELGASFEIEEEAFTGYEVGVGS